MPKLRARCNARRCWPRSLHSSCSLRRWLPPIGSANVAIADPDIPPPPSEPCVVPLFDQFTFIGFDAQTFDFAPPDDCPGPWQKVVLSADFDVTAGRQFDRTAEIWLGGANIYFGTTQEPRATVAPTWHIERDVTDYSRAVRDGAGRPRRSRQRRRRHLHRHHPRQREPRVLSATSRPSPDQPPRPDVVVPLAPTRPVAPSISRAHDDHLAVYFTLADQHPARLSRRHRASSEQRRVLVPVRAGRFRRRARIVSRHRFSRDRGHDRRHPVGIAPIYPWIYTGGIDPGLWRPSPGIQTLSFEPYRVDLTPYAAWLSDGQQHRHRRARLQRTARISRRRRISCFISITARDRSPANSSPTRSSARCRNHLGHRDQRRLTAGRRARHRRATSKSRVTSTRPTAASRPI